MLHYLPQCAGNVQRWADKPETHQIRCWGKRQAPPPLETQRKKALRLRIEDLKISYKKYFLKKSL